jgi:hypothetical protein
MISSNYGVKLAKRMPDKILYMFDKRSEKFLLYINRHNNRHLPLLENRNKVIMTQ